LISILRAGNVEECYSLARRPCIPILSHLVEEGAQSRATQTCGSWIVRLMRRYALMMIANVLNRNGLLNRDTITAGHAIALVTLRNKHGFQFTRLSGSRKRAG